MSPQREPAVNIIQDEAKENIQTFMLEAQVQVGECEFFSVTPSVSSD